MIKAGATSLVILNLMAAAAYAQPVDCGATGWFDHKTKHHGVKRVRAGSGMLFYTAPLAVNTDGAPTSYHPRDPAGNQGLAINTICNGADAILPGGTTISYDKCPQLIAAFKQARDSGWTHPTKPRMRFYGVAANGFTPCLIKSGPHAGYFVSTTSQPADPAKGLCDQGRYLDSLELPFSIYPGHSNFTSRGVGKRDVVVIRNPATGRIAFGIIGDKGPAWGLGEVSVYFSKYLQNLSASPKSRKETYSFAVPKAHVLILNEVEIKPPYTLEKIRTEGAAAFANWGGAARLQACIVKYGN